MKKKGFTLIELLAVIVILAIIALIATPLVLKYIEKSRQESKVDSAYSFVRNLETEITNFSIKNNGKKYTTDKENIKELGLDITVKGENPTDGKVCISDVGQVEKAILQYGKYYVSYDGKKGSVSDKDTYDNFSCSGNGPGSGTDVGTNYIIDEDLEFAYNESQNAYIASLSITKEIADQFKEAMDYDFIIDNGEIETILGVNYDSNLIFYTYTTDSSKIKVIMISGEQLTIRSMEKVEDVKNVKIGNPRSAKVRTAFKINYNSIAMTSFDFVAGTADVVIKNESNDEYYKGSVELTDNEGDGIIGIDNGCRHNIPELSNVYTDLINGKTIIIEVTQMVEGREVVSSVSGNLNSMLLINGKYEDTYYTSNFGLAQMANTGC